MYNFIYSKPSLTCYCYTLSCILGKMGFVYMHNACEKQPKNMHKEATIF